MRCLPSIALDFVPRAPSHSVQIPANENNRRDGSRANQTISFLPAMGCFDPSGFLSEAGLGFSLYSEMLVAGTRQRFSGFSPRQCGEVGSRMFVFMPPC